MGRAEPSVNIQVRLKYQDILKNPVELGPGMHHRSARPHQAADTSAPGQPARPRTLGTIRLPGGRGGHWARGATRRASWPAVAARPAVLAACAALVAPLVPAADRRAAQRQPAYAGPRQRSSPGSNRNRGAGNNHMFFKIDVGFAGQVWSSQVREAKSRSQVKRAGRLLLSAPQLADRVPGLRGLMWWDRRSSFSGKGGAERWMAHEHGELGIGPGEPGTPAGVNIASPGITDS